jgi:hypothetical protein
VDTIAEKSTLHVECPSKNGCLKRFRFSLPCFDFFALFSYFKTLQLRISPDFLISLSYNNGIAKKEDFTQTLAGYNAKRINSFIASAITIVLITIDIIF